MSQMMLSSQIQEHGDLDQEEQDGDRECGDETSYCNASLILGGTWSHIQSEVKSHASPFLVGPEDK